MSPPSKWVNSTLLLFIFQLSLFDWLAGWAQMSLWLQFWICSVELVKLWVKLESGPQGHNSVGQCGAGGGDWRQLGVGGVCFSDWSSIFLICFQHLIAWLIIQDHARKFKINLSNFFLWIERIISVVSCRNQIIISVYLRFQGESEIRVRFFDLVSIIVAHFNQ